MSNFHHVVTVHRLHHILIDLAVDSIIFTGAACRRHGVVCGIPSQTETSSEDQTIGWYAQEYRREKYSACKVSVQGFTVYVNPNDQIQTANAGCLLATIPLLEGLSLILKQKEGEFSVCPSFCKNLYIVMYRKIINVSLFLTFSHICSSFWNFESWQVWGWR